MASTATTFDTDCKYMGHQDDTSLIDSSDSAHVVTLGGNVARSSAQSKFGGFSAVFDGTTDYLTLPSHADFDFGTGDFTIDFWVRFVALRANLVSWGTSDTALRFDWHSAGGGRLDWYVGGTAGNSPSFATSLDTWYHHALTRSSGTCRLFIDGDEKDSWTAAGSIAQAGVTIGIYHDLSIIALNGFLDEFRIVKGTAVWTANFTPPVAAYTKGSVNASKLMLLGVG